MADVSDSHSTKKVRVAGLSWEAKLKELKDFQDGWSNQYKQGDYIDAMDTVQKWCLTQIQARDDNHVRCHFDGWSSRWDLQYRWTSYKIAPFRRYSKGYTGQVKTPLRPNLTFEAATYQQERARILELVANNFSGLTAFEITQYLRGRLFVLVDFVMSSSGQTGYTEEDCNDINQFLYAVLDLTVAWLKRLPGLLKKSVAEHKKEPDLF